MRQYDLKDLDKNSKPRPKTTTVWKGRGLKSGKSHKLTILILDIIFQFHDVVFCSLGFDFIFESVWSYCDNDKAFMSEVIHRLDVIVGENLKIKTNIGDIEKEIELQSDKVVVVSDLLVKVQKQTTKFQQITPFGK